MENNWFENTGVFGELKSFESNELSKICKEKKYVEGDIIFNQGDDSTELYILKKGAVQIRLTIAPQLSDAVIYTVKENEIFGEFAFIEPAPRSATASCAKDSVVIEIRKGDFEELVRKFPNIGLNFYQKVACSLTGKLRKTNQQLRETLVRSLGLE